MAPFQQRVVDEKRELDDRIEKLNIFRRGQTFAALLNEEQARLIKQESAMLLYSAILGERIAAFRIED